MSLIHNLYRKTKVNVRTLISFVFFILLFVLLNRIPVFAKTTNKIQGTLVSISTNVGSVINSVFTSEESLRKKLNISENLVVKYAVEQSKIDEMSRTIQELRTQVGYIEDNNSDTISAKIISRTSIRENSIFIDKGRDSGIIEGLGVSVEDGLLIGKIEKVNQNTSKVRLIGDKYSKIPAAILNSDRTIGLVEGTDGFLMNMGYIPQEQDIKKDDIVVTSGLEGNIPSGLVIGRVIEVIKIDTDPFMSASIEPLIDLRKYTHVLVLKRITDL